jgi:hypothetical protein
MEQDLSTDNEPDDDLIREVYARFGLAYYQSECLHRELCMILAWSGLPSRDLITCPRVEELLAHAFSLTLGDVAAKLEGVLPAELSGELQKAVDRRNFLAHHLWFERVHLMFRVEDVRELIAELNEDAELFDRLDTKISEWSQPKRRQLGLTDEVVQASLSRILAGESEEPLPDRQTVRELERKLSRRQRLIRVWEFTLDNGRKPLLFELADASLWQLCDVGLGWTRFSEVGSDWTEHPAVKPHLPADILPRPQSAAPWDYEFKLANGAVLWVKPGRQKQTFRWGVQAPKVSAEQGAALDGDSASLYPSQ